MAENQTGTSFWLYGAAFLTVTYVVFIGYTASLTTTGVACTKIGFLAGWFGCLTLNELGDFLAGAFAPLAFIWLAAAVLIQSQELKAQRRELTLTHESITENREVMKAQAEEARKQAQFIGQQTAILEREQESREEQKKADIFAAAIRRLAGRIKDCPDAFKFRTSVNSNTVTVRINRLSNFNGPEIDFIREVSNIFARQTLSWETNVDYSPVDPEGFRRVCKSCDQALQFYDELSSRAQIDAQTCNLQELKDSLSKVHQPAQ